MGWSYVQNLALSNHPNVLRLVPNNTRANWMLQLLQQHNKIAHKIVHQPMRLMHVRRGPINQAIEIDERLEANPMLAYHVEVQSHPYKSNEAKHSRYHFQDRSNLEDKILNYQIIFQFNSLFINWNEACLKKRLISAKFQCCCHCLFMIIHKTVK